MSFLMDSVDLDVVLHLLVYIYIYSMNNLSDSS